jgi:hypothetical protein
MVEARALFPTGVNKPKNAKEIGDNARLFQPKMYNSFVFESAWGMSNDAKHLGAWQLNRTWDGELLRPLFAMDSNNFKEWY